MSGDFSGPSGSPFNSGSFGSGTFGSGERPLPFSLSGQLPPGSSEQNQFNFSASFPLSSSGQMPMFSPSGSMALDDGKGSSLTASFSYGPDIDVGGSDSLIFSTDDPFGRSMSPQSQLVVSPKDNWIDQMKMEVNQKIKTGNGMLEESVQRFLKDNLIMSMDELRKVMEIQDIIKEYSCRRMLEEKDILATIHRQSFPVVPIHRSTRRESTVGDEEYSEPAKKKSKQAAGEDGRFKSSNLFVVVDVYTKIPIDSISFSLIGTREKQFLSIAKEISVEKRELEMEPNRFIGITVHRHKLELVTRAATNGTEDSIKIKCVVTSGPSRHELETESTEKFIIVCNESQFSKKHAQLLRTCIGEKTSQTLDIKEKNVVQKYLYNHMLYKGVKEEDCRIFTSDIGEVDLDRVVKLIMNIINTNMLDCWKTGVLWGVHTKAEVVRGLYDSRAKPGQFVVYFMETTEVAICFVDRNGQIGHVIVPDKMIRSNSLQAIIEFLPGLHTFINRDRRPIECKDHFKDFTLTRSEFSIVASEEEIKRR